MVEAKERWTFRFSLRTSLVFIGFLAIWLGWYFSQSQRQRRAVDELGPWTVGYDYQWDANGINRGIESEEPLSGLLGEDVFHKVFSINANGGALNDEQIQQIKQLHNLRYLGMDNTEVTLDLLDKVGRMQDLQQLSLQFCEITDELASKLDPLPRLERLWLSCNEITDEGLESISNISTLRELYLQKNQISDAGLAHIGKLDELESLDLSENLGISDDGLVHLLSLKKIRVLVLWKNSNVTDDGLNSLHNLTSLRQIELGGTSVTKSGIEALKSALPKLSVSR